MGASRAVAGACVVTLVSLSTVGLPMTPANAAPPHYSHTWYVTNPDAVPALGASDALYNNQFCATAMVILDWGQLNRHSTDTDTQYDHYGMDDFAGGAPFVAMNIVADRSTKYIEQWEANATCGSLDLVVGTNNSAPECPTSPCNIYYYGENLALAISNMTNWMSSHGYLNNPYFLDLAGGSDIEGDGLPYWDTAANSRQAVDGYNTSWDSVGARFVDYGDPFTSQYFASGDQYYVNWQATHDWPLPQDYGSGFYPAYDSLDQNNVVDWEFLGALSQCGGADPLPTGTYCLDALGHNTYTPTTAFNNIANTAPNLQTEMSYSPNIKNQ